MAMVMVGCKLPNGLVIDVKGKGSVSLNGSNTARGLFDTRTAEAAPEAIGLTMVEEEFWSEWCRIMKGFAPLENGLVFASAKKKNVLAEAKEKASGKTGLERLSKPEAPIVNA